MFITPSVKINLQNIGLERYVLTEHVISITGDWDLEDSDWQDRLLSKFKPTSPWMDNRNMNEKIKKKDERGRGETIHTTLFWKHPV